MSAHLRVAWASRITAAGETIWRGLNVKLPPSLEAQIDKLAEMPTEEWQIGQRFKIAPLVVDHLKTYVPHWDNRTPGLGRHWTTRKDFAGKAAMQGNYGGTWIMLSATYDPAGVDHEHSYSGGMWESENEITLLPGARVTITGVYVRRYGLDFNENLCQTPIRSTAASVSDDPSRWAWLQAQWDKGAMEIQQTKVVGRFKLHLEPIADGDRYIHATTLDGEYVGSVFFGPMPGGIEGAVQVKPAYRRQGLATAMYSWAEQVSGKKMVPGAGHTDDAEALWNQPHRPFGSKTAAKFSPSQIATWETTRPWHASRADLEAQMVPGFRVGQARGSEDASFEGGFITLKEQWFDRAPEVRRGTCYHEAGHGLESEFSGMEPLPQFGLAHLYEVDQWTGAQGLGPNYGEQVAEAYAALWTDPGWFTGPKVQWKNLIEWMARKKGYPLP